MVGRKMVRHIVSWNFREEIPEEKRAEVRQELSRRFPALVGKIPGLIKAEVGIPPLSSSNCDMALYCEIEDEKSLYIYQKHPEHQAVAAVVKAHCHERRCVDMLS